MKSCHRKHILITANPIATRSIRVLLLLTSLAGIIFMSLLASHCPKTLRSPQDSKVDRTSTVRSIEFSFSRTLAHCLARNPFSSRSRLYGLPLADRHAALNAACSLRHRLPRRALVNFYCRLVLGKDVGQLKVTAYARVAHSEARRRGGPSGAMQSEARVRLIVSPWLCRAPVLSVVFFLSSLLFCSVSSSPSSSKG